MHHGSSTGDSTGWLSVGMDELHNMQSDHTLSLDDKSVTAKKLQGLAHYLKDGTHHCSMMPSLSPTIHVVDWILELAFSKTSRAYMGISIRHLTALGGDGAGSTQSSTRHCKNMME
jgi:hypothetical protein